MKLLILTTMLLSACSTSRYQLKIKDLEEQLKKFKFVLCFFPFDCPRRILLTLCSLRDKMKENETLRKAIAKDETTIKRLNEEIQQGKRQKTALSKQISEKGKEHA